MTWSSSAGVFTVETASDQSTLTSFKSFSGIHQILYTIETYSNTLSMTSYPKPSRSTLHRLNSIDSKRCSRGCWPENSAGSPVLPKRSQYCASRLRWLGILRSSKCSAAYLIRVPRHVWGLQSSQATETAGKVQWLGCGKDIRVG